MTPWRHITDNQLPEAIICDIDGTLAKLERDPHDLKQAHNDILNLPIATIIEVFGAQKLYDIRLILLTGRNETSRHVTEKWLATNSITHYEQLLMRPQFDFRKDTIVKREMYEQKIKGKYDVLFVLEDRAQVVEMWRELGLTCLQVDYGNF